MKNLNKLLTITALSSLSAMQTAQATSTFHSQSTVTITIDSITNTSNAGDLSGLDIYGLFEFDAANKTVAGSGDATYNHNGGEIFSFDTTIAANNNFSQSFSASGHSVNGSVASDFQSLGGLEFINNSNDNFSIAYSIDYSIEARVDGITPTDTAHNTVALEYGNILTDINFIEWLSDDDYSEVTATTEALFSDLDKLNSSAFFTLELGALEYNLFYADVSIDGYTEAVSAVPVPAAAWLLLSGLAFLGRFRSNAAA